jgi:hypothetical protein
MAVSASSVASLVFCGVFAISVVASSLRRTIAAARTVKKSGGYAASTAQKRQPSRPYPRFIARRPSYRLGNMKETTPVRTFLSSLTDC